MIDIDTYRDDFKWVKLLTDDEIVKQEIKLLTKELDQFQVQLNEKYQYFVNFVNKYKGLTPERIQKFEQFTADESFVGDQCVICMEDIEIGRNILINK